MGMRYVELFMRIEEEFDLDIPDAEAEPLVTAGNMFEYLARKTGVTNEPDRALLWRRVQAVIADEVDVPVKQVTPRSEIVFLTGDASTPD